MAAPLLLEPVPTAAGTARRYVSRALTALGYVPLVEAGMLGISEIVTNATIHARTEILVQVRDLGAGVRIEVLDSSPVLPTPHRYAATSGVGRGLRMLDAYGTWGVEPGAGPDGRPGKLVWFEPADEADPAAFLQEDLPEGWELDDPTGPPSARPGPVSAVLGRYGPSADGGMVSVRLLRFPLQLFAAAREHHDELIRELSLLALASPEPDRQWQGVGGLPEELQNLIEVLGGRYRAAADRADAVRDAALARGELSIDLTYRVPASARESMQALRDLMDQADKFCRQEQLLTLAEDPLLNAFRRWFSTQCVDQIDGAPPSAWPGPLTRS